MAKTAILSVRVVSDTTQGRRGLSGVSDSVRGVDQTIRRMGETQIIADMGRQLLQLAGDSVRAASDAQQAVGAVESVFGALADGVQRNADAAAQAVGLSSRAYNESAAVLGAQLQNMGVAEQDLVGTTDTLIGLGADLAATFGGSTADAVAAVSSLLRGERDPIERYGITMNQAAIDAQVLAMGLDTSTDSAARSAQTQATLALLMQQSAGAAGQFAREADSAAGAEQRMNAEMENAQAALGEALLPIMTQASLILADLARWVQENTDLVLVIAGVVGIFTLAIWAMNVAMLANPMTLIVAGIVVAIGLLVAAIWWLGDNWEEVWEWLEGIWNGFVGWIEDGIDAIVGWVQDAIGWFASLFGAQQQASGSTSGGGGTWLVGAAAVPQQLAADYDVPAVGARLIAASVPPAFGAVAAVSRTAEIVGGNTYNITVNGAIDIDGTARTIRRVLERHDARTGRAVAAGATWR